MLPALGRQLPLEQLLPAATDAVRYASRPPLDGTFSQSVTQAPAQLPVWSLSSEMGQHSLLATDAHQERAFNTGQRNRAHFF